MTYLKTGKSARVNSQRPTILVQFNHDISKDRKKWRVYRCVEIVNQTINNLMNVMLVRIYFQST
jgi:hypothetical protein